jgi:PPP family 3-phenylpropionic acid transporter
MGIAISAFIPYYVLLLRHRGLSADRIGLVLAVTSLAGVAATPFWSHAADTRLGTVHTLQTACAAACIAGLALMATGSSLVAILGVAAVLGAAQGPQSALTDALTLRELGGPRLTQYGRFRLWASIGWGVASIAFGALFTRAGIGLMLAAYVAGLAVYAIYVSRFPSVRPSASSIVESRLGSIGDALLTIPRLAAFMVGVLIFSISTHAAWDFVPLRIVGRGGDAFLVGVAVGVSAFVEIPFMRASTSLVDRFGLRPVFAVGASVYVAASIAWTILPGPLAVTLVRIGIGMGFGLVYVTLVLMTARLVPERLRNTGQALLSICSFGLAPVIGGAVGGVVYQHVGPPQLFAGSAVGIAAGTVVVYLAAVRVDDREVPAALPP